MHAVGAPGHRGVDALAGPGGERAHQLGRGGDQQVGSLGERRTERRVDHVRRGQPVVDPRSLGWADRRLHHVDEGGHVVIGDPLAVGDLLDEGVVDLRRVRPARGGGLCGDLADLGPALRREQLDLEPGGETGLVGEQLGHVGGSVAGDHDRDPFGAAFGRGGGRDVGAHLRAEPSDCVHAAIGRAHARVRAIRRRR